MPVALNRTKTKRSPFSRYRTYVSSLQVLMGETKSAGGWDERVEAALNGQAGAELRRVAALKTRRKYGVFFTGINLSEQLLACCASFEGKRVFHDPTVGMGDLLLAAAKKLPLGKTLKQTLTLWGRQLSGADLHAEFVEGAKIRLVLLARQRHHTTEILNRNHNRFFPLIRVANGLKQLIAFQRATNLLLNPPFGLADVPSDCKWAGGRMTQAATFVVKALERIKPGTEVLAILPEVLRSGSFSKHWRNRINELAEVHLVKPYGVFDESADVDVFLLRLVRRGKNKPTAKKRWPIPRKTQNATVADYFNVHVGRVVPHRDPETGPQYDYIHPRCVPTWIVMRTFSETRRHEGLVYQPPFVVVRRTSRPGHPYRATATVIAGKQPIAVENHLIVCEPKDKSLANCRELMRQLETAKVNDFLNRRIRCRHLTVSAVEAIPFTP